MEWFSKNKTWLAATGLFAISVLVRYLSVDQSNHPTGWDGYYYLMQIRAWTVNGHLQSADYSLIYPFFISIAMIVGDALVAFKVGVALLSGFLTLAIFYYLYRRGISLMWMIAAGAYICFSPIITYFILQFPKNVLGLVFLVLFSDILVRSITEASNGKWWRWVPYFVTALLALMTHRMTGVFALLMMFVHTASTLSWKWLVGFLVVVAGVSLLPGILHISDLERLRNSLVSVPQWTPWSFYRIFETSAGGWMIFDLIIISALAILCFTYSLSNIRRLTMPEIPWLIIATICLFPFSPVFAGSTGYRFFLIVPVALVLFASEIHWGYDRKGRFPVSVLTATILLIFSFWSYRSYNVNSFDPPNPLYATAISNMERASDAKKYHLVIAHKALAEMIIFQTEFDALNWLPDPDIPTESVLRIISGVRYQSLRQYMEPADLKTVVSIARGYFCVPEDGWQRFVSNVMDAGDKSVVADIFAGENPMKPRPYYLNKGK
jgi:hypothetical protein